MPEATWRENEWSLVGDGGGNLPGLRWRSDKYFKVGKLSCLLKVFVHVVQQVSILHQLQYNHRLFGRDMY